MMSAEILRRAAALMRERAEAATPGPWAVVEATGANRDQRRTLGQFSMIHDTQTEVAIVRGFPSERTPVAEHIASWDPVVALAVADWLDADATVIERHDLDVAVSRAYAVARAYLGESS